MAIRFLWPGRTRQPELRAAVEFYAARIRPLAGCEIVETRAARGLKEENAERIKSLEADGLEKYTEGAYIICLSDTGIKMTSNEFARFLRGREETSGRRPCFVVGGFLGLAGRILERADTRLSLSPMTFSHELCRVMLLEQVYRALTINRGRHYAK
jgi:23S rRNA (pseudouridine1915-N3)-methyltransferase